MKNNHQRKVLITDECDKLIGELFSNEFIGLRMGSFADRVVELRKQLVSQTNCDYSTTIRYISQAIIMTTFTLEWCPDSKLRAIGDFAIRVEER